MIFLICSLYDCIYLTYKTIIWLIYVQFHLFAIYHIYAPHIPYMTIYERFHNLAIFYIWSYANHIWHILFLYAAHIWSYVRHIWRIFSVYSSHIWRYMAPYMAPLYCIVYMSIFCLYALYMSYMSHISMTYMWHISWCLCVMHIFYKTYTIHIGINIYDHICTWS